MARRKVSDVSDVSDTVSLLRLCFLVDTVSDTFHSSDAVDGGDEFAPRAALRLEDAGASGCQAVIPPAALAGLLDPTALDPAALLEPVQQRIQRGDAELEHAARPE